MKKRYELAGWEMEDLDLPPDALASVETTFSATGGAYIPPTPGNPNTTSANLSSLFSFFFFGTCQEAITIIPFNLVI